MGRRDAVQFTLECAAEWRRLGALVTFEPGWETRGNGTSADYEGAEEHHTATPSSLARPFPTRNMLIVGRTGLPGPLCNDATPVGPGDRPQIHVIAAHPANHAGASGGARTAPLPVTRLFNPRVRGNEIDYGGDRPMTPGQYRAALIHGRGVVDVLRRSTEYARAHAETSVTGKWDPGYAPGKTIDMAAFRRDAAALGSSTESSPAPSEEDELNEFEKAVLADTHKKTIETLERVQALTFPKPGRPHVETWYWPMDSTAALAAKEAALRVEAEIAALRAQNSELVGVIAKLSQGDDIDVEALVARIDKSLDSKLADHARRIKVEVSVPEP